MDSGERWERIAGVGSIVLLVLFFAYKIATDTRTPGQYVYEDDDVIGRAGPGVDY